MRTPHRLAPLKVAVALVALLFGACDRHDADETADDFILMLDQLDDAIQSFINGEPSAFKALWSQSGDVTLSGGLGGEIERGWESISARLERVSAMHSSHETSEYRAERVSWQSSEALGYLVQHERIQLETAGDDSASRAYRVTMVFRRESDGWRIVHRQADSHTVSEMVD
jgi:hypothetical protein